MKAHRRILLEAAGWAMLTTGLAWMGIQPASAATQTDIQICNSSASTNSIVAYKTDWSWSDTLPAGYCSAWVNNTGSNPVRVNVNNAKAYKLGKIGEGYGDCHAGPNTSSNPPNDSPNGVRYRTWSVACPYI